MIGQLSGKIINFDNGQLLLDVTGVGYQINISERTASKLPANNSQITMLIYTHVRQDRIQLFGFSDLLEKKIFEMLLSVSGVGVKLAITILSQLPAIDCLQAIVSEEIETLSTISGLGKKTAKRLVLELKEKATKELSEKSIAPATAQDIATRTVRQDLSSALANLGYHKNEIDRVLANLEINSHSNFEKTLRRSLKLLAGSVN